MRCRREARDPELEAMLEPMLAAIVRLAGANAGIVRVIGADGSCFETVVADGNPWLENRS